MEFFYTHVSPKAIQFVSDVLRSGRLSEGVMVRRFEQELTVQLGWRHPVTVNSGTFALHLALVLAGGGPGDEVILPAQTFVATGLGVLMRGATPVFADIHTGNLYPADVRRRLTERTRIIMPVHWAGYPCDLDELNALAAETGIAIIEDAAHAMGATYQGQPIGTISQFTAFSFQASKHLTNGDGGALCCREERAYVEARRRRWFGIDREQDLPNELGERQYNLTNVGYKYHLNDLAAATGLGNLDDIDRRLENWLEDWHAANQGEFEICDRPKR